MNDPEIRHENQLKKKLYDNFQDSGMLNSLKAQMRQKLLDQLKKNEKENDSIFRNTNQQQQPQIIQIQQQQKGGQLLNRILASIFSDYLKSKGMNYTLSVFLPEVGDQHGTLSKLEIMDLLNIDTNSTPIVNKNGNEIALLEIIINEVYLNRGLPTHLKTTNSGTQTDTGDAIMNLEQRLSNVDEAYKSKTQTNLLQNQQELEEKLLKFKQQCEQRLKTELAAETAKFRNFEIASVRIEEAEKYRQQMAQYREELEQMYQEKMQKLRDREKETIQKCAERMQSLENANHAHRATVMKDFEALQLREENIVRQQILNAEKIALEKQQLKNMQQQLEEKVKTVDHEKLNLDIKYNHDIAYNKLAILKEMEDDKLDIFSKKQVIDRDFNSIQQIKEQNAKHVTEIAQLTKENTILNDQLREIKMKKKQFETECDQYKDNLRVISESARRDSESLRNYQQQITLLNDQIAFLKMQLDEQIKQAHEQKIDFAQQSIKIQRNYQQQLEEQMNQARIFDVLKQQSPYQQQCQQQSAEVADTQQNFRHETIDQLNQELEKLNREREQQIQSLLNEQYAAEPIQDKFSKISMGSELFQIKSDLQNYSHIDESALIAQQIESNLRRNPQQGQLTKQSNSIAEAIFSRNLDQQKKNNNHF